MRIVKFSFLIIVFIWACSQVSYGCSCIGTNFIDKSNSALKKRYENSKSAIFTAKVLSVEKFYFDEGSGAPFEKKKVTVEIDKYWINIKDRKVSVNTGFNSGDCGVYLEKGKTYFFIAEYDKEKQLWTHACDYNIFSEFLFDEKKLTKRFTEILRKPKVF